MLKKRIIPIQLLINSGRLVKTTNFGNYRDVGDPVASSKIYNAQYADELILLNIDRENRSINLLVDVLWRVSEACFMPLAVGGGMKSFDDAKVLITGGADKVVLNSVCYSNPALITEIVEIYGSQAVTVSIDAAWDDRLQDYALYADCGRRKEELRLPEHIARVVEAGAGEILINSIDRDGTMSGYDIELLRRVTSISPIPVIACGGAGNYLHLKEALVEAEVSAAACGSLFNFGDNNPIRAKAFLTNYGIPLKVI